MSTILTINSSLFGQAGQSSQLSQKFVDKLLNQQPDATVIYRDFASDPVAHLSAETFQGFALDPTDRNEVQKAAAELSDQLISELKQAGTLVLGLPMYNFGVPSTLKAYFDYVARAGVTFKYTEQGVKGLLEGKKAYVLATRGGQYKDTPLDTETTFVTDFLAFLGIKDVTFIYAEGLAMGEGTKEQALQSAAETINELEV